MVTDRFPSDGCGHEFTARPGEQVRFQVSGAFIGTLVLEQWAHGSPRRRLALDAAACGVFTVGPMDDARKVTFRWVMTNHGAGEAVASVAVAE